MWYFNKQKVLVYTRTNGIIWPHRLTKLLAKIHQIPFKQFDKLLVCSAGWNDKNSLKKKKKKEVNCVLLVWTSIYHYSCFIVTCNINWNMYISLPDSENSVYHLPIRAVTIKKKKKNQQHYQNKKKALMLLVKF